MLNQLIESKNHQEENARKNGFLFTTLGVLVAVLVTGWTYSLFAKNFAMGTGNFELANIVAPVVASEDPPPPPAPEPRDEKRQTASSNEKPMVMEKVARMEDSLEKPPRMEDARALKSSPLTKSEWDEYSEGPENRIRTRDSESNADNDGLNKIPVSSKADKEKEEKLPEVVVKPKPEPSPAVQKVTKISGGVLNGKASFLAKPPYPAAARSMNISGTVNVQVLIDEKGNVVSASVVSGHFLLRAAAESAARQSKFTPTYLSEQPVKVTGVIVYQFRP